MTSAAGGIALETALAACPLIAILRGVTPETVLEIGAVLIEAGFRVIEVPLNSPRPIESITRLAKAYGHQAVIGAGTVMSPAEAAAVAAAGGRLVVMPHADPTVIGAAKAMGHICLPGVATPTEAFAALAAGADGLKLFPGELVTPAVVKALRAVLPAQTLLVPVGGVSAATIPAYRAAGARAFGIGSALYTPGRTADEVATAARSLLGAL